MSSAQSTNAASSPDTFSQVQEVEAKRAILERAIEENRDSLLRWVAGVLVRMSVLEHSHARTRADIAADVLTDACLAVLRNAHRFEAGRDPVLWIKGCALNLAKRHREQIFSANRAPSERREVSASEMAGEGKSVEDVLEEHAATLDISLRLLEERRSSVLETEQALKSLLAPLSEAEREIITLSVFADYDSPRLAAHLGIAPPAARKRLQRALDRLRAHICSHPEQFSWIENLPSLLGNLTKDFVGTGVKPEAEALVSKGRDSDNSSRHSRSVSKQHPQHDASQAANSTATGSKITATRSSGMTISSAGSKSRTDSDLDGASSSAASADAFGSASVAPTAHGGEVS